MIDSDLRSLICYESDAVVVVNKPPCLPVQSKSGVDLESKMGELYTRLHLINRIDQPASGIVIFAKTAEFAVALSEQIKSKEISKNYWAVVGAEPGDKESVLTHSLLKSQKSNKSKAVGKDVRGAKMATLSYRWLGKSQNYHLLSVKLETGRHHQIRAQLAAAGLPIKGDVKYGFRRKNHDRSIHLHAISVTFSDPAIDQQVFLAARPPQETLWNYFTEHIGLPVISN